MPIGKRKGRVKQSGRRRPSRSLSHIQHERDHFERLVVAVDDAVPLTAGTESNVACLERRERAVVAVLAAALENVVHLAVALMDIPANLAFIAQIDVVEQPPLALHIVGVVQDTVGLQHNHAA